MGWFAIIGAGHRHPRVRARHDRGFGDEDMQGFAVFRVHVSVPTAGHHGFIDALRGSVTQRVLHEAPCPILAMPA